MVVEKRPTKSTLRPLHPWKLPGIKHLLVCRVKLNSASWHIYHKINNTKNSLPYHWKLPNIKHFLVCRVKLNNASWHIFHERKATRKTLNLFKKSLKIPKGQSESVYRRRTDNTMAKRKRTKGQTTINKVYKKTKDRVTRTPLKTGGELKCSGRVSCSCSTSDTRRVNLVTNPVISHERGKDREVLTTSGTYPWSFVTQIFHNGQPNQQIMEV